MDKCGSCGREWVRNRFHLNTCNSCGSPHKMICYGYLYNKPVYEITTELIMNTAFIIHDTFVPRSKS